MDEKQNRWQRILLLQTGSVATLLLFSFSELPAHMLTYRIEGMLNLTGAAGLALVLFLAASIAALSIALSPDWKATPLTQRRALSLGFAGAAWAAGLALDLQLVPLTTPPVHLAWLTLGLGLLALSLWLLRRPAPGEEFP